MVHHKYLLNISPGFLLCNYHVLIHNICPTPYLEYTCRILLLNILAEYSIEILKNIYICGNYLLNPNERSGQHRTLLPTN